MENETKAKREPVSSTGIKKRIKQRLIAYADSKEPRVVYSDCVSIAVEEWLDKQEK